LIISALLLNSGKALIFALQQGYNMARFLKQNYSMGKANRIGTGGLASGTGLPYTISRLNAKVLAEGGELVPLNGWKVEMPHMAPISIVFQCVTQKAAIEWLKIWLSERGHI